MKTDGRIRPLLWSLGAGGSFLGIRYLEEGIQLIMMDRSKLNCITKGIYMVLADEFHTHWKNVDRDMRTAINMVWKQGNRELLYEIADRDLKKKPKNSLFMEMIADYIWEMDEAAEAQEE